MRFGTAAFFQTRLGPLLKMNHEASVWPHPQMTEKERQQHVDTIAANDGVTIDASRVVKNPALRQMCKLFLNSAWRKSAQNPQKVETKLIGIVDGGAVFAFFNSPAHEPTCFEINVVYGSITTAVARMCLYEAMNRAGADNLVYCENLLGDLRGDGHGKMTNEMLYHTSKVAREESVLDSAKHSLDASTVFFNTEQQYFFWKNLSLECNQWVFVHRMKKKYNGSNNQRTTVFFTMKNVALSMIYRVTYATAQFV
ncbi:hypothetical protein CRE_04260 [Caenorhabditis remanei]|uniref:Uncharacterized protein n=1 Tax=Caenorhabditis remanei TaxID=31234 RepID=E3N685_CAERE|nr:hypothetical protein CRE_04260 [Caenorhabditis remanei]